MCTICIPKSVREYYTNKAVRKAVDALLEKLDGRDSPELGWNEARKYNQALLMAAQVRTDFIEFLFEVWDGSFGNAEPNRLQGEYFDFESSSPAGIWDESELARYYYRNGNPDDDGPSDELGVFIEEVGDEISLRLWVARYDNKNSNQTVPNGMDELDGWEVEANGEGEYLVNKPISIMDLDCKDMRPIKRFAEDARRAVQFLVENPPD